MLLTGIHNPLQDYFFGRALLRMSAKIFRDLEIQ